MRKVLITAVGGDVAGGIMRCMKEAFPGDVFWGCDIKPEVPFLTLLDRYEIVPRSNTTQYRDKIMELCRDNGITHFCPTTEEEIILGDGLRDFFERHKIALMINKSDLIRIATSKYKTSEFFFYLGIASPKTYLLDAYNGQLAFPVIVKPDYGRGSSGMRMVEDEGTLETIRKTAAETLVVQQYVGSPEKEYTVGVFSDGAQTSSIAFRRTLGPGGMSVRVETVEDEMLKKIAGQVAEALALKGAINIQLRRENGVYYIFEINPRLSSTVRFRHKLGFKDAAWWLELLDGNFSTPDFKVKSGVVGLRYVDEVILE